MENKEGSQFSETLIDIGDIAWIRSAHPQSSALKIIKTKKRSSKLGGKIPILILDSLRASTKLRFENH